jgi:hypothetical protein
VQGETQLLQVVLALRSASILTGPLNGWKQNRRQQDHDPQDHNQFDHRESAAMAGDCLVWHVMIRVVWR